MTAVVRCIRKGCAVLLAVHRTDRPQCGVGGHCIISLRKCIPRTNAGAGVAAACRCVQHSCAATGMPAPHRHCTGALARMEHTASQAIKSNQSPSPIQALRETRRAMSTPEGRARRRRRRRCHTVAEPRAQQRVGESRSSLHNGGLHGCLLCARAASAAMQSSRTVAAPAATQSCVC